jgi:hypothetical protein
MKATENVTFNKEDIKYIKNELEDLREILRELENKHLPDLDNVAAAAKVLTIAVDQVGNNISQMQDEIWDKVRNIENYFKGKNV